MKKTSVNFKKLFQKIHQEHLAKNNHSKKTSTSLRALSTVSRQNMLSNISLTLNSSQMQSKEKNIQKRPRSARPPSAKITASLEHQMKNETVKRYFSYVDRIGIQMAERLLSTTEAEIHTILKEFEALIRLLSYLKQNPNDSATILEQFDENVSNTLQHRKTRTVFYFIFAKYLQCNPGAQSFKKQLKLLEKCQQYSRALGNFQISLYSCVRIQQIFFQMKRLEECKSYAGKVLRLSVYLKDRFEQFKAIESLKIMGFYEGKINNSKEYYLNKQEKEFLVKNYHPTHDLAPETEKERDFHRTLVYPTQLIHEEQPSISDNVEYFISNMALMKKNLTDRSKDIMSTLNKVNKIGSVNKYLENGGYITLQPRSRFKPDRNRGQILLTHYGKNSHTQSNRRFHKLYLPKIIQMVSMVYSLKNGIM